MSQNQLAGHLLLLGCVTKKLVLRRKACNTVGNLASSCEHFQINNFKNSFFKYAMSLRCFIFSRLKPKNLLIFLCFFLSSGLRLSRQLMAACCCGPWTETAATRWPSLAQPTSSGQHRRTTRPPHRPKEQRRRPRGETISTRGN